MSAKSIQKWFSKKLFGASNSKTQEGSDHKAARKGSVGSGSTSSVGSDRSRLRLSSKQTPAQEVTVKTQEKSEKIKIVETWIETWRQKRLDEVIALSDPDCMYLASLDDGEVMEILLQDFIDQMKVCYASFPDYNCTWETVEEDPENDAVVIKNFVSNATHTGEPFAFGPFPAIPANGTPIKDDPVSLHVQLKNGKPCCIRPESEGGQIGPASYYSQIGGIIF